MYIVTMKLNMTGVRYKNNNDHLYIVYMASVVVIPPPQHIIKGQQCLGIFSNFLLQKGR